VCGTPAGLFFLSCSSTLLAGLADSHVLRVESVRAAGRARRIPGGEPRDAPAPPAGGAALGGGRGGVGGGGNAGFLGGLNGATNTGGGGGGQGGFGIKTGGNGGSGVVIVRYPDVWTLNVGVGLTASTATVGSDKVTTFTAGTGTITFS
jgi:hypothetical protein